MEKYGFNRITTKILEGYLAERAFWIRIEGTTSIKRRVKAGAILG